YYPQTHISMVIQDGPLLSGTVLQHLLCGRPDATEQELIHAARQAHAHTFIEALPEGYATSIGHGCGWLSGGERQPLSIA
ncbi:ABC transporter ATP-binding protein, partial [Pseudomonas syringae pv. tagetis]